MRTSHAASLRRAIALCRSQDARQLPADVECRALERVRALLAAAPLGDARADADRGEQ
jgi:hypothetical protein